MMEKIEKGENAMYGKIQITGVIETRTGMHIGGSSAFAPIGAVDSPIITDTLTNLPMIPGSSLKGKMRTMLARQYNSSQTKKHNEDAECIIRLFGTSEKINGKIPRGRLLFSDMVLCNSKELYEMGLQSVTEIKYENTIHRLTAIANPRQIERVVRGAKFELNLIYELDGEDGVLEDMEVLAQGMKLLEYDYIGGSGSRGYGKISFKNVQADAVIGDIDPDFMERINRVFTETLA